MALPNVFLLTVDSLRYDYFADYQEELADSTDGVEFTDAVPTATMTSSSMPALATGKFEDEIDAWLEEQGRFQPHFPAADGISPRAFPGTEDGAHMTKGLEHDEMGRRTEEEDVRGEQVEK